jgi:hypothetical protein
MASFFLGCSTPTYVKAENESYKSSTGCIGALLKDCGKNLRPYMTEEEINIVQKRVADNNEPDVNGDVRNNRRHIIALINLEGQIWSPKSMVEIDYTEKGIVNQISISLPWNLSLAETEAQYEHTRVYEATALAIGANCSALKDRGEFYRLIHNQVKRPVHVEKDHVKYTATTTYSSEGKWIEICGFNMMSGENSMNNAKIHSAKNPNGAYSKSYVKFK